MDHAHHHGHHGHETGPAAETVSHVDHQAAMADPAVAKRMEADMGRRFRISFLFTVPVVLYSPLFTNLFGVRLPAPIPVNWLLLLLTTPVVSPSPPWTGGRPGWWLPPTRSSPRRAGPSTA